MILRAKQKYQKHAINMRAAVIFPRKPHSHQIFRRIDLIEAFAQQIDHGYMTSLAIKCKMQPIWQY